jgi:hypothetical protein
VSSILFKFALDALKNFCNIILSSKIELGNALNDMKFSLLVDDFSDCNDEQTVSFYELSEQARTCKYLKINFPRSTDLFGRITIYNLKVFGSVV